MLNNFPETLHPMSQFSAAITAMNSESKFAKAYAQGVHKSAYWEVILGWFLLVCISQCTRNTVNASVSPLHF